MFRSVATIFTSYLSLIVMTKTANRAATTKAFLSPVNISSALILLSIKRYFPPFYQLQFLFSKAILKLIYLFPLRSYNAFQLLPRYAVDDREDKIFPLLELQQIQLVLQNLKVNLNSRMGGVSPSF